MRIKCLFLAYAILLFCSFHTIQAQEPTDIGNTDYTIPEIHIDIVDSLFVTSKTNYLKAYIRINGNGLYADFADSVSIKGRGNTSWHAPKRPYRLKFDKKKEIFGLKKGKNWVLLAHYQRLSAMTSATAMQIGKIIGMPYTNNIIPVELYINGVYQGSYAFTEHVGISNNSVDLDDETSCMLELDTYYDEAYKFCSTYYDLPVNIKEPNLEKWEAERAERTFSAIEQELQQIDSLLHHDQDIDEWVDMTALAQFLLVNDLVRNAELNHPKSTFLFRENINTPGEKFQFGPLWDFDWAFGYDGFTGYFVKAPNSSITGTSNASGSRFFRDIMENDIVRKYYYKVWKEFMDNNGLQKLFTYLDEYHALVAKSLDHNTSIWNDGDAAEYAEEINRMKTWLQTRAEYIYNNLKVFDLDEFNFNKQGDTNKDNALTVQDIRTWDDHPLLSITREQLIQNILSAKHTPAIYYNRQPKINDLLSCRNLLQTQTEKHSIEILIDKTSAHTPAYLQFDVCIPTEYEVEHIVAGIDATCHYQHIGNLSDKYQKYRVVLTWDANNHPNTAQTICRIDLLENGYNENTKLSFVNILYSENEVQQSVESFVHAYHSNTNDIAEVTTKDITVVHEGIYLKGHQNKPIHIYDLMGRCILSQRITTEVHTIRLRPGFYIIRLSDQTHKVNIR